MNNYIQEISSVVSNKLISETMWEAILESPKIAALAKPGQFVNILPSNNWDHVMRRPMSIGGTDNGTIKILYKVIGDGTNIMSQWNTNDVVDLIGPLGNKWDINTEKKPVLVSGGVGVVPLLFLRQILKSNFTDHLFLMGARTKNEHFLTHEPRNGVWLTTDDGTAGLSGNVINALEYIIEDINLENIKLYGCGPSVMLESVKKYAESHNVECEVALECIMACGIGICQGCAVEMNHPHKQNDSYRDRFKLVCVDGPVYKANELKTCLV